MEKIVTIIGSRKTPQLELDFIEEMAEKVALNSWILRSGAAIGADKAGEDGFIKGKGQMEIYLPHKGFQNSSSQLIAPKFSNWQNAVSLMLYLHPNPNAVKNKPTTRDLLARDVYQILGKDLNKPSDLVICYTPEGKLVGGTALALRVCQWYKEETNNEIPVINIGSLGIEKAHQLISNYI
mgnify:FL=1